MLEARSLTKYYDHTPAVLGVSFTIQPGEILGCLGPNGAGKSTTVKMLTGLIDPSDGQIFYQGRSVHDDFTAFQRRIGYVPEEAHLYPHLSGREYLQLVGRLRGLPRRILDGRMDEFLRLFALWDDREAPLASYSKGMRQKILLSAALLHNPDILILDEPFSGLDVTSAMMLRSLLRSLAGQGKMILYSSHVLEVVERVCSNVMILRKGEVVAYDSIHRLRELMSQPSLEGVFAQLAQVEDSDATANRILEVMSRPQVESAAPSPVATGLRLYRGIAGTFPAEFQNAYGPELLETAEDAIEPVWRRHGVLGLVRLLADIAIRVPVEYAAELAKDIRYGLRTLAASPGFTAVALLSLTLGITIATCSFSEMNGIVLRSLPVAANPEQLIALQMPVSYPAYKRYRDQRDLLSAAMAYVAPVPFSVSLGGNTRRTWGHLVTPSYFSTFGVRPALGSFFDQEQEKPGQAPTVVVSYRFWQEHLAADPSAIGKTLRINGQPAIVAGVGPADFLGASPMLFAADLWLPIAAGGRVTPELADNAIERRDLMLFHVVGRLQPGVTLARAEAELDAIAQQLQQDSGDLERQQKGRRLLLVEGGKMLPLRKQDLPFFTSFFTIMAGLIMLIACANVANMMLARAAQRRKEMAVRLALGASRMRLIRQLLTESMLVAGAAGVLGFLISVWLLNLGSQLKMPLPMPVAYDLRPDARVLLLTVALTLLTGLAFGLAPALQATRTDLTPALKEGGDVRFRRYRRLSLRSVLMVAQLAGSLTLLVILGLLSFGIQTTLGMQAGFNPNHLYLVSLDPVREGYSAAQATAFLEKLLDRVKLLPSITAATLTESIPVAMAGPGVQVATPEAGSSTTRVMHRAVKHVVGRDYFATAGIPILRGRAFRREDEAHQAAAVIVSEQLVREFWNSQDPVGRRIEIGAGEMAAAKMMPGSFDYRETKFLKGRRLFEVVGVAGDVTEGLVVQKPRSAIYFPLRPADYAQPSLEGVTLMVRATPGTDAIGMVLREIALLDANIKPVDSRSMAQHIDRFMAPLRGAAWTYALIGAFGMILAAVGLAGVTAYSVARRSHEIGIRIALGARRGDVLRLVMKESAVMVMVGTAVGMAGAWAGARMLSAMSSSVGQVTSTSTSDPAVVVGAPLLLAGLALVACYLPALRSTRIDPVAALRQE